MLVPDFQGFLKVVDKKRTKPKIVFDHGERLHLTLLMNFRQVMDDTESSSSCNAGLADVVIEKQCLHLEEVKQSN